MNNAMNQHIVPVWLTVPEAAERARVGARTIYSEVKAHRLRAAKVGGKKQLRFRAEWIDSWLESSTTEVQA